MSDFIFSLILLPFILIAIIVFGILILIEDGKPVFYNSERRGQNGSTFKIYKLRSMKNNSPDLRAKDGSTLNSNDDPRLTRVGKFIRKLSIDELPQVLNVLIGDMSFVGPRPSLVSMDYNKLDQNRKKRLNVKPGITGYSQAYFRNSISQEEKIKKDCYYVDNISLFLDIKILFKTLSSVIHSKNIYNG